MVEERLARWMEEEAQGHLPQRVFAATFDRTRTLRRRPGPFGWRLPEMPRALITVIAAGAVAIALVFGAMLAGGGGPPASAPTAPPSPSPSSSEAAASPTFDPRAPIDVAAWTPHTSEPYGFTFSYPPDWTLEPATRAWNAEDSASFDIRSAAMDSVSTTENGGVRFSAFVVPVDEDVATEEGLLAWIESWCAVAGSQPCTDIGERIVPMCVERRDCHYAVLVPFQQDVQLFAQGPGEGEVTVAAVWRPEGSPSVAEFGGARRLLEAFLSTWNGGGNAGIYPAP
jgi:hypothetical protein